jgi:hypothetical protein
VAARDERAVRVVPGATAGPRGRVTDEGRARWRLGLAIGLRRDVSPSPVRSLALASVLSVFERRHSTESSQVAAVD